MLRKKIPTEKEIEMLKMRSVFLNTKFKEILNELLEELDKKKKDENSSKIASKDFESELE